MHTILLLINVIGLHDIKQISTDFKKYNFTMLEKGISFDNLTTFPRKYLEI